VHPGRFATDPKLWSGTPNWNTFQFLRRSRYADRVSAASTQPAIDGWFATDGSGEPYLIGGKCHQCGTYVFPPRANNCPNPSCDGDELAQVPLSRRGTLWSYTENRYAPPPPYPSPDPFEPFAVAAVQLADEGLIVLGKVVKGTDHHAAVRRRRRPRAHRLRVEDCLMSPEPLYILGAGMHPWGKWGNDFTEYGVAAARAALAEAGLDWRQIQLVAGADTIRNGYPGFVAGATFAQKLGWNGVPVSSSYAACASGSQALQSARAQILAGFCDVALVIGADTTPKGFFAPVGGERKNDPDWQRFHLIGATNTVYFAMLARRRMDLYGATLEDFAAVKVKNSRHGLNNPNARYRKEASVEDVLASPVVSDPLRLLDICATSDGAAALIVASAEFAKKHLGSLDGVPSVRAVSTVTPRYPQHLPELPDIATDSTAVVPAPDRVFKDQILDAAYAEAGIGPDDLSLAEVYDLSTALELDWYEHLGLCPKGEAEQLLRSGATTIGGRIPVNPSGGLACFGEAIPAQAIAQVCELTWQLKGQATGRQVEGATVGVTANQGLFGHGSSVVVAR
jgi:acetyl-CoA acetyltransferase/uncharacterized OB-fold protein